jgi:competence protein ComEA
VRRLTGLGLIPDPPGWVPDQAREVAEPDQIVGRERGDSDPPPVARVERPVGRPRAERSAAPSISDAVRDAVRDRVPPWADGLVDRITLGGLIWMLVGLIAVVVAGVMYVHRHGGGATSDYPAASTYSAGSGSGTSAVVTPAAVGTEASGSIVVDVGGKVRKPGLVTLPTGARVADAITAAGGPLRSTELDRVDLAARVTGAAAAPGTTAAGDSTGSPAPISLSDATVEQLETLPGVGPVTAQKIVDWRTAHGGFTSVSQLQQIPGIGPAHYSEISPLVAP